MCYHYTTSQSFMLRGRTKIRPLIYMGWVKGLEPSTPGTTIRCSNQLSYTHHINHLARQEGFEPPTYCLEGSCSILLSYWRISRSNHFLERAMGIEPTYPAWKAGVLPLNYARMAVPYIQPYDNNIIIEVCQHFFLVLKRTSFYPRGSLGERTLSEHKKRRLLTCQAQTKLKTTGSISG